MAYYSGSYAFDLFEPATAAATASSAAPQRREEPRKAPPLRKVPGKTKKQVRTEQRSSFLRSVAVVLFAGIVLSVIGLQLTAFAKKYELKRQIAAAQSALQIAQSENVRLHSELNGITSIDKISRYATEELGMIKAEKYQIECIDLSEGDRVLFSGAGRK